MAFCPKCGKEISESQTFCEDHRPKNIDSKPFDIRVCDCGRFFSHNRWFVPNSVEESALKVAKDHIKQRVDLRIDSLPIPQKRTHKEHGRIIASFQGEEYPIDFPVKLQICDKCAKVGTHYFTAKLQLRDPPQGVLEFVESTLEPLVEKGVSVNKVEHTPRGPDLFLTHKSVARQLAEKLVRKFGGSMKISEQLFSRNKQTSKNLYRLNVMVQFTPFRVSDVVLLGDKAVLVTGVGKSCTGRDLFLDKKVVFHPDDKVEVLKKYTTTISRTKPTVEVIHPVTFQSVPARNHPDLIGAFADGQKVKVVVAKNKLFLL